MTPVVAIRGITSDELGIDAFRMEEPAAAIPHQEWHQLHVLHQCVLICLHHMSVETKSRRLYVVMCMLSEHTKHANLEKWVTALDLSIQKNCNTYCV